MDATPPGSENGDAPQQNAAADDDSDVAIVELNTRPLERHAAKRAAAKRAAPARRRPAATRTAPARRKPAVRRAASRRDREIEPGLYLFRLVSRSELGRSGVVAVQTPLGRLAVGMANGEPFAVSDTCRHLFASLGEGRVTRDGCLQCPWHRSRYDVRTGHMVRGPQGLVFLTVREIVRAYTNVLFPLHVHPVVERNGVLYLETAGEADAPT